jgi:hypothetical protein
MNNPFFVFLERFFFFSYKYFKNGWADSCSKQKVYLGVELTSVLYSFL